MSTSVVHNDTQEIVRRECRFVHAVAANDNAPDDTSSQFLLLFSLLWSRELNKSDWLKIGIGSKPHVCSAVYVMCLPENRKSFLAFCLLWALQKKKGGVLLSCVKRESSRECDSFFFFCRPLSCIV